MGKKSKQQGTASAIPVAPPSTVRERGKSEKPLIDIPEDEQWRIIRESGILNKVPQAQQEVEDVEEPIGLGDEIFNAVLLMIPFTSLLLLMEILIRHQYGKRASVEVIAPRMLSNFPILALFIFYTNRHKYHRRTQMLLFFMAIACGCRMLWLFNNANWITNMKQAPQLATMWIYALIQLNFGPSLITLLAVGGFVWWKDLKIFS